MRCFESLSSWNDSWTSSPFLPTSTNEQSQEFQEMQLRICSLATWIQKSHSFRKVWHVPTKITLYTLVHVQAFVGINLLSLDLRIKTTWLYIINHIGLCSWPKWLVLFMKIDMWRNTQVVVDLTFGHYSNTPSPRHLYVYSSLLKPGQLHSPDLLCWENIDYHHIHNYQGYFSWWWLFGKAQFDSTDIWPTFLGFGVVCFVHCMQLLLAHIYY